MNIQTLIPNGQWKSNGEYVIKCPFCGDSKSHDHLHVNVELKRFYCFYCGKGGHISTLFLKLGLYVKDLESKVPVLEKPQDIKFEDFTPLGQATQWTHSAILARDYLIRRGVTEYEISFFDMRVTYDEQSKWYGRVIIPICEMDRVVCFAGRSYIDWVVPKYLFPRRGETLLTTAETLFTLGEYWVESPKSVVIVEGIFDALAVRRRARRDLFPVAVMSKTLKDPQLYKLLALPQPVEFIIMLDADAHWDGVQLAKKLSGYGRDVKLALLKQGDPDSCSIDELNQTLEKAEPFSFEVEMAVKMGNL